MKSKLLALPILVGGCYLLAGCASTPTTDTHFINTLPVPTTSYTDTPPAPVDGQAPSYSYTTNTPSARGSQATATANARAMFWAERTSIAADLTGLPDIPTIIPTTMPTIIPTYVPDRPLSALGPWAISWDMSLVANLDGTGETPWLDHPALSVAIRPGSSVAGGMIVAYIDQSPENEKDISLKLTTGLRQEPVTVVQLWNKDVDTLPSAVDLAWSPDGSKLAFTGAMDGESLDVYVYDLATQAITRLTDGPLDASWLMWSDDGCYVIHYAADLSFIGMGGPWWDDIWSARADGGGAVSLLKENEVFLSMKIVGWLSPTELRIRLESPYNAEEKEYYFTYYIANIETGAITPVFSGPYYDNLAYAKEYGIWLMSKRVSETEYKSFMYQNGERYDLPDHDFYSADWLSDYDRFVGITRDGGVYTISPDRKIESMSINMVPNESDQTAGLYPKIHVSPDKTLWLWYDDIPYQGYTTLWIGEPMAAPKFMMAGWQMGSFHEIDWSPDSQYIAFLGDERCIARRPDFEFECVEGKSNIWGSLLIP